MAKLTISYHWEILDDLGQYVDSYYGYETEEEAREAAKGVASEKGLVLEEEDDVES